MTQPCVYRKLDSDVLGLCSIARETLRFDGTSSCPGVGELAASSVNPDRSAAPRPLPTLTASARIAFAAQYSSDEDAQAPENIDTGPSTDPKSLPQSTLNTERGHGGGTPAFNSPNHRSSTLETLHDFDRWATRVSSKASISRLVAASVDQNDLTLAWPPVPRR